MTKKSRMINWQLYLGFVLVLIGGLFLADQLFETQLMATFWPVLVILFGLTIFVGMLVAGKKGAGLAIPGSVMTTLGVLFFIQNSFDLWVTWAYAWALLICATGLGLLIMNGYHKQPRLRQVAGLVIGIGLTTFVVFGVLFELIFNMAGTETNSGVFLGAGLVLLGVFVVFSRALFHRKKEVQAEDVPGAPQEADMVVDSLATQAPQVQQQAEDAAKQLSEGASFTRLHFNSVGEVVLIQGDACGLKIEGDPQLVKKVRSQLQDDELRITYEADIADWTGFQWISLENRLRYYVTVRELSQLRLGGAGVLRAEGFIGESLTVTHAGLGSLSIKGLQCRQLAVSLGGLGEIRLTGEVQSQVVELSGGGGYQAADLRSQTAEVNLTGAGSAKVWVEQQLTALVSGAGTIAYKGEPQVAQTISGLGTVKPLGA